MNMVCCNLYKDLKFYTKAFYGYNCMNSYTCFIRKPLSIPLTGFVLNIGIEYDNASKP